MVSIIILVLTSILFAGSLVYLFSNKHYNEPAAIGFVYISIFIWGAAIIFCGIRGF